ncbi:nucleotidyltransferase domain-containing protein [Salmonirosea aquatica]|uniref:Nucleotidyltransferase family protein n=1 Tax=Salmonirosea aquatica TaxID=2654236 RepID=A0A7C9BE67_9BACT|nr:hypothetical protein [Cytophagaceae bacterium SJW1-29]
MEKRSVGFSPELSLLISTSIDLPLDEQEMRSVRSDRLLALARWHNVRPQLFSLVQGKNESWVSELRQECLDITVSNLINTQETIRVAKILEENQIPVYAYKGCVWAEWLYGQVGKREFGDIDMLVGVDKYQSALDLVTKAGFSADPYRIYLLNGSPTLRDAFLRTDYHVPMLRKVTGSSLEFTLEMHWKVSYPRLGFHFPSSEWSTFELFHRIQNESLRSFSNEYQFLLLLMHHGGKERWLKLKYIADFATYLSRYGHETDWEVINEMAQKKGIQKLVEHSLGVLRGLGLEWKKEWPDVTPKTLSSSVLKEWENMPKNPKNSTWAYFRHALTMRDTLLDRLKVGKLHLSYASEFSLLYHKALWYLKNE